MEGYNYLTKRACFRKQLKPKALERFQMKKWLILIFVVLILLVTIGGNSEIVDAYPNPIYSWPPDRVDSIMCEDSTNAAFIYEEAELAYQPVPWDFNKFNEITKAIRNDPEVVNQENISSQISKNSEAIALVLRATSFDLCDFAFGNPRPHMVPADTSRKFIELMALTRLMIIQAMIYDIQGKHDSSTVYYNSVFKLNQHIDSQQDGIFVSKLVEVILLRHLAIGMIHHINHLDQRNSIYLSRTSDLISNYLSERRTMLKAFHEDVFVYRLDLDSISHRVQSELEEEQPDLSGQEIDQYLDKYFFGFEQEYLKGRYQLYDSFKEAFTKNDPSIIPHRSKIDQKLMVVRSIFRTLKIGNSWKNRMTHEPALIAAEILNSTNFPLHGEYIKEYYLGTTELEIALLACKIKLAGFNEKQYQASEIVLSHKDPFNKWKPLNINWDDNKVTIYSVGPNRRNNKGQRIREDFWRLENQRGFDLGYIFWL